MTREFGRIRGVGVLLAAMALLALVSAPAALGVDRIYWGNGGNNTISYANLDGSGGGGQLNLSGATPSGPRGVAIDAAAGRIYWANQSNNTISYANLDGSGGGGQLNISGTLPNKPHGLAIDPPAGKIYWVNDDNTVSYANLDNSGGGQLNIAGSTPDAPYGAAIDPAGGRLYWANRGNNSISYANLDNSGGGQLNLSGATPEDQHGVAIDSAAGRIYWANVNAPDFHTTLSYANLDGSGGGGQLNQSGASAVAVVGLAIDPTTRRLYLGNLGNDTVSYANLDNLGGGGLVNISGATPSAVRFPAILHTPSGTGAPQIAGGSDPGSVLTCSPGSWAPDDLGAFYYRAPQSVAFQWTRNGAPIAGATDTSYTAFASGEYRCTETATNAAGPTTQASAPIRVGSPPDTKLVKTKMSRHHKARFIFGATGEVSGYQCKLKGPDGPASVTSCSSPQAYRHLQPGRYRFWVSAWGPGGVDATPAEKRLTIP
jgi:DNA-binding beta-propeller fold protein YncE